MSIDIKLAQIKARFQKKIRKEEWEKYLKDSSYAEERIKVWEENAPKWGEPALRSLKFWKEQLVKIKERWEKFK